MLTHIFIALSTLLWLGVVIRACKRGTDSAFGAVWLFCAFGITILGFCIILRIMQ
jgi:uncharacterized membrane protein YidH (DUF202 family)